MNAKAKLFDGLKIAPKPHSTESLAAASAFIEAGEEKPLRVTPPPAAPPAKDPLKKVIVYVPESLANWLRQKCFDEHQSVSGFVAGLVRKAKG